MENQINSLHEDEQERLNEVLSLQTALEYLLERSRVLKMEITGVLIGAAMESVVEEVKKQIDLSDTQATIFLHELSHKPTRLN